jgi:predicted MFS family arabinose efflux permease
MTPRVPRDSVTALLAIILLASAGAESMGLAPLIVSTLTAQGGLSAAQAGQCLSAENAGNVVGALIIILGAERLRRRSIAILALLLIAGGNAGCWAGGGGFGMYAATRCLAGLGGGLAMSAYGMLAGTRQATRNYAINSMCSVVLVALGGAAVPFVSAWVGPGALFVLIAFIALIALGASAWLPQEESIRGGDSHGSDPREGRGMAAVLSVLMSFFYFTSILAFWSYAAEIGIHHGLTPTIVEESISMSFLVAGIGASVLVTALGVFAPPRAIILSCAIVTAVSIWAVVTFRPQAVYVSAVAAFIFAWFLIYPFFMGVMAAIDPNGKLAVVGMFSQMSGAVAGPFLGGMLSNRAVTFSVATTTGILICLVCALMIESAFFPPLSAKNVSV